MNPIRMPVNSAAAELETGLKSGNWSDYCYLPSGRQIAVAVAMAVHEIILTSRHRRRRAARWAT